MSDFITNLVRRSAGLPPKTAVMPPFQARFAPDLTVAAPDEPPVSERVSKIGSSFATVTPAQKTAAPETPTPLLNQPEAHGATGPLSAPRQPDQPRPGERPPTIFSPPSQDSIQSVAIPREAPATIISTPKTKHIMQPTAQPLAPPGAKRQLPATVEPQIMAPNAPKPPATSPLATVPPTTAIHQKEGTVENERVTAAVAPPAIPMPRPTLITSSLRPDTDVTDLPSPVPVAQPAPTPHPPLPLTKAKVFRPAQPDTNPSTIEVRIGAVEVRASQPPTPTLPRVAPKPQGFSRYAQLRGGGEWE